MYKFGKKSLERLNHPKVHPDLKKLMVEAIKTSHIDFTIIETVRTMEQQKKNVAKGVSKTMKSRHIPLTNRSGLCEAIDIAPYPIDWTNITRFKQLAGHIKATAKRLNIPVTWGGDWGWDYPHWEIKR